MKKTKMIVSLFITILIMISAVSPVAAETLSKNVTVACIDYPGMHTTDTNGNDAGFAAEYFEKICEYTGWNIEFVDMSWSEVYESVKTGETDFYCVARRKENRESDFDFSTYALIDEQMNLYVMPDSDIVYEDYSRMNGMRVGMLTQSEEIDCFKEYMSDHNFNAQIVEYESNTDAENALVNGEIDAVALVSYSVADRLKPIANFGMVPAYLMSAQGSELMQAFNRAQQRLLIDDADCFQSIQKKYFTVVNAIYFSAEELAYIENCGEITVGQIPNRYGISNYDEETGEMTGINEDILQRIAELTGLNLVSKPIEVNAAPLTVLKNGEFDLVMGVVNNENFRNDKDITMSNPFLSSTIAVVMRDGEVFNSENIYTVGVKKSFQFMQEYMAENYPQFTVNTYESSIDILNALKNGEIDILMENMYVTNYLLQKPVYSNLEIMPTTFMNEENCIVSLAKTNPCLISIIDKAIARLTNEEIDNIILANTTAKPYQMTTADVLYKYQTQIIIVSILGVICIAMIIFIIILRHKNYRKLSLKNIQLAEAVRQAERANVAKSQFLSRMSHEIRTPMNAIVGLTTIAKTHDTEPEKVDEYLAKIDSSSKVLLSIINDVLDMSAIESEKLKIANDEFDLKQLLEAIANIYYTQCKSKGITFNMGVDLSAESVVGDSLRVNQILMNLISNAYKFTDKGGTVKVSVHETSRKNKIVFIRFVVSDTGCGMTEEMLTRLFKPFEQESAQTAQKAGGSGLGLSIAKNLVDMMHGAIKVESKKGEGTTFTVELPFGLTGHKNVVDPEKLQHMRVLIVDDDQNERLYTSVVLERIGVSYDVACNAEEAIQKMDQCKASGGSYDICFTDWKMPGTNGVELTQMIRDRFGKDTLVIIVSAYDLSEVQDEAKEAGADMFITKPLFQSTVFNVMMQITGGIVKNTEPEPEHYDFSGHKLLLAEDNEMNTEVATDILGLVNMSVDHAENGRIALELFEKSKPGTYDLILMDIQMPEMDGYQATKAIRSCAHPDAKVIPIYAMTANAFTDDVSKALSSGMNGHIAKPIDTKILYRTLNTAINTNRNRIDNK